MMKKNRHVFVCNNCQTSCMIYRKGKNHRVLVCPECGVLATNGVKSIAMGASKFIKKGMMKPASLAEQAVIGTNYLDKLSDIGDVSVRPKSPTASSRTGRTTYDNLDKPNKGERYVNLALGVK